MVVYSVSSTLLIGRNNLEAMETFARATTQGRCQETARRHRGTIGPKTGSMSCLPHRHPLQNPLTFHHAKKKKRQLPSSLSFVTNIDAQLNESKGSRPPSMAYKSMLFSHQEAEA